MQNNYDFVLTTIRLIQQDKIVKLLLDNNADVHAVDAYGNTVFHYAIRSGNIEIVKTLVEHIGMLCKKNAEQRDPLQISVEHGNKEITNYLLDKLSDSHTKNPDLVHIAAMKGYAGIIQLLYDATLHNQREAIATLKTIGANHEANDYLGYTPLLCAALRDNIEVFEDLWEYCCKTKVSLFGNSVVMVAVKNVKNDSINCLKFMIDKIKNDEIMSKMFMLPNLRLNTPLHVVAEAGNIEVFKMIKDHYTNIYMRNIFLQTPLHLAVLKGHVNLVTELLNKSTYGVNLKDRHQTPLILAIKANSSKIISLLLKHGASDLTLDLLNLAIREGKLEALKELLKTPLIDQEDFYPLHVAIENKQIDVIKMLLNLDTKKVKIITDKVLDIYGTKMTCLDYALKRKYEEGVKAILEILCTKDKQNITYRILWQKLMYRRESHNGYYSPIQMMILYMPNMANYVFTKCISENDEKKEYTYDFLEDIYYMPNAK
uniref:Ankyrin repeat protein n=2 Tax=Acrobeloides nanus TaxID=290746 RepID=A0A914BZ29_9BILA